MKASPEILKFFADFIFKELGIVYQEANYYQLDTRLTEIAKQLGLADSQELYNKAKTVMTPQMRLLILDLATNNETSFFRDPKVFRAIEQAFTKEITFPPHRKMPLRVWSAACSYGQEVYTLAMTLDKLKSSLPGQNYEILATDISERALKNAEAGTYTQLQIQRGLPATHLVRYFTKADPSDGNFAFKVKPELKDRLRFKKQNLLQSFIALGTFDLILCRNVLIYQTIESKKEIIGRLFECLEPGGILVLGAAESLLGIDDRFEIMRLEGAVVYRRPIKVAQAS